MLLSCNNSKYFYDQKFESELMNKIKKDIKNRDEKFLIVYFFKDFQKTFVAISTHDNLYNLKPSIFFKINGKTILFIFQNIELENFFLNMKIIRNTKIFNLRENEMKLDGGLNKIYLINYNSLELIKPNERLLELSFINKIPFIPPLEGKAPKILKNGYK